MGFCRMQSRFQHSIGIIALIMGILIFSSYSFAQVTPTLRCGESQGLGIYVAPFTGLINILGAGGTGSATVNGISSVRTMTNGHAEDASTQTAYNSANGGVELGCKLENASAGVMLTNDGSGTTTTVLRLSTPTNAHAEIPSAVPTNYSIPIQLGVVGGGSILVREVIGGGSCNTDETLLVRLYSGTNAHAESPNFAPANYITANSYSICLKYSSGTTPAGITDIVATDIGITSSALQFPTGTNTFNYTQTAPAGTPTPVYIDAYINKTAPASASGTGAQELLLLCFKNESVCDSIVANFNHPDFYKTTFAPPFLPNSLQGILMNSGGTGQQLALFSAPYSAGIPLAGVFPSNVFTIDLPSCPALESIPAGSCGFPNMGINQLRIASISGVLDTGTFSAFGNTYTVFPTMPSGAYTMRVISVTYPAFTTYNGTPHAEIDSTTTPPAGVTPVLNALTNNADAAEIIVSPPGTGPSAIIQDLVENQINFQNFGPGGSSAAIGSAYTPTIGSIVRTVPGINSQNVETVNVYVYCRPDDMALDPAFVGYYSSNGAACSSINDAMTLLLAAQVPNASNILFNNLFRRVTFYGENYPTSTNFSSTWSTTSCNMNYPVYGALFPAANNNWLACPTQPGPPAIMNGAPTFGTAFYGVSIPLDGSVPAGTYRVLSATFPATATIGGTLYSEGLPATPIPLPPNPIPVPAGMANNFAAATFTILPAGTTPTTCNNNNICEPALGEDPVTCPNDCKVSTPGDVYVLKDISLPQRYKGEQVDVTLTIQSKKAIPNSTQIEINVKDKDGKTLAGYPDIRTIGFSGTLNGGVESVTLPTIALEAAASPPNITFKAGETYTLYARVKPYDDLSNNSPSVTFDESVLANNSAFKTFTVPEAPQTFSIPDQPWWMSILLVAGLLGWMFVASKKK